MIRESLITIAWRSRELPLEPAGIVAFGRAARTLAAKFLRLPGADLTLLQGVCAQRMILVTGESEMLPWADGAAYLGRDTRCPAALSLLFPTTLEPELPLELFAHIFASRYAQLAPCAVTPEKIIPFGEARKLSGTRLTRWLEENK